MSRDADKIPSRIESWNDLSNLVEHFSRFSAHDWLFRGVSDEAHGLIAKIGRERTRAAKRKKGEETYKRLPCRSEDESSIFSMFRSQALSYVQRPPTTQLEWLALAQHYGLPTRLLDWTESILVAAWFAVEGANDKNKTADSAIWVTRGLNKVDAEDTRNPLTIKNPHIYRPAHISARISAQASVLMLCPSPKKELNLEYLHQITIARKIEFTLKKRLNACGINKRLLFPDLQGLAEHLTWLHKFDYLEGYRVKPGHIVNPTPDDED